MRVRTDSRAKNCAMGMVWPGKGPANGGVTRKSPPAKRKMVKIWQESWNLDRFLLHCTLNASRQFKANRMKW